MPFKCGPLTPIIPLKTAVRITLVLDVVVQAVTLTLCAAIAIYVFQNILKEEFATLIDNSKLSSNTFQKVFYITVGMISSCSLGQLGITLSMFCTMNSFLCFAWATLHSLSFFLPLIFIEFMPGGGWGSGIISITYLGCIWIIFSYGAALGKHEASQKSFDPANSPRKNTPKNFVSDQLRTTVAHPKSFRSRKALFSSNKDPVSEQLISSV